MAAKHTLPARVLLSLVVTLVLVLAACGGTPTATPVPPTATPVPPTATPAPPITTKVDVGGYDLFVTCKGSGAFPVIFENGLGSGYLAWNTVASAIETEARVCMYSRAGTGTSGTSPKSPRTSMDMVDDLHALLGKIGLHPPYVLVGHSFGGLNVHLYASRYPQEVVGLVLVDSAHPDQIADVLSVLPPRADNENVDVTAMRNSFDEVYQRNMAFEGGIDMTASRQQAKAAGKLGSIPLVVLSHTPGRSGLPKGFPEDLAAKYEEVWSREQKDLLSLSTNSRQVIADKSSHQIPSDQPELVTEAILSVLKQVQSK